jgi:hypothetical protein
LAGLTDLDLTTSSTQLTDDAAAWAEDQKPGWTLSPGHLETMAVEMFGRMASILAILAQTHSRAIYGDFVSTVLQVPTLTPTAATGTAIFTLADTIGHTIPAGVQLAVGGVAFTLADDATAAAGTSTAIGPIVAVDTGAAASGLSGPVELVDLLAFVDTVALDGVTTGGTDGETPDEYVDRVHDELPTLSLALVTPRDAELLAQRVPPVDLAMAIDRYVPAGPGGTPAAQTDVDGAITVAVRDSGGLDIADKTAIVAQLAQRRVSGLLVSVIGPTGTAIDVTFTGRCYPGWDPITVRDQAVSAIQGVLSGANWGVPSAGEERRWINETVVERNDLINAAYVQGMRHIDTLTLAVGGGVQGTADITLPGPAPVPSAGAVTGTVTT